MNTADLVATATANAGPSIKTTQALRAVISTFERIPHGAIALLARYSIAMTFWTSGQTKVEGLVLDPIGGNVALGWPRLSENAVELFRSEYALPVLPPELAATLAATAEHVLLLLLGLASRLSAFALLSMTLVIQVFVYPLAWPIHGLWAALLLYLMARGPGAASLDHLLTRRLAG